MTDPALINQLKQTNHHLGRLNTTLQNIHKEMERGNQAAAARGSRLEAILNARGREGDRDDVTEGGPSEEGVRQGTPDAGEQEKQEIEELTLYCRSCAVGATGFPATLGTSQCPHCKSHFITTTRKGNT